MESTELKEIKTSPISLTQSPASIKTMALQWVNTAQIWVVL